MPPKATGGATRGRGRGRGGRGGTRATAAAVNVAEDAADTPQQSIESTTISSAAETAPPVLKSETSAPQVAPTVPGAAEPSDIAAAVESGAAISLPASSVSSPQTVSNSPAPRPSVQRLDTIKQTAMAPRSASPSSRGGKATRGKKPAIKPTFTGRRSKEEREARDKADALRERERQKEREIEKKKQQAAQAKPRGKGSTRGRGGYSGPISGPFSFGAATQERRRTPHTTSYTGSRATQVKDEGDEGPAGSSWRQGGSGGVKREDGGYVSSDDDTEIGYPRKDVDELDAILVSSDEEAAAAAGPRVKSQYPKMAPSLMPVRIRREEHRDRVPALNTDASETTAGHKSQSAKHASGETKVEGAEVVSRKGKSKAKDVEITDVRRPYRGMWNDSDESEVHIKPEPTSDDEVMEDAHRTPLEVPGKSATREPPTAAELERRLKLRSREPGREFLIQTEEDQLEWERYKLDMASIRRELGPEADVAEDGSGDVAMKDANAPARTVRDNNVYLFQFPPIVPELIDPEIKKEESSTQVKAANPTAVPQKGAIKTKDEPTDHLTRGVQGLNLPSGRVGKLRVHESGRTTLEWGNTSFVLNPGQPVTFLQEAVSIHKTPEQQRMIAEDGGDSISFGRVKGKFVVQPDIEKMLG